MPRNDAIRTVSLRLPAAVHRAAKERASKERLSLTAFIIRALENEEQRHLKARLQAGFKRIASEEGGAGIEYAIRAQSEVMLEED